MGKKKYIDNVRTYSPPAAPFFHSFAHLSLFRLFLLVRRFYFFLSQRLLQLDVVGLGPGLVFLFASFSFPFFLKIKKKGGERKGGRSSLCVRVCKPNGFSTLSTSAAVGERERCLSAPAFCSPFPLFFLF